MKRDLVLNHAELIRDVLDGEDLEYYFESIFSGSGRWKKIDKPKKFLDIIKYHFSYPYCYEEFVFKKFDIKVRMISDLDKRILNDHPLITLFAKSLLSNSTSRSGVVEDIRKYPMFKRIEFLTGAQVDSYKIYGNGQVEFSLNYKNIL